MIVFKLFCWPLFWVAAVVLATAGCLVVWWCYFKKGRKPAVPLPHRWKDRVDECAEAGVPDELMGKARPEPGVMVVQAEDFSFAGEPDLDKSDQLGLVADVQQEIKSVCEVLAAKDGDKSDFLSMLEMVKVKYPKIGSHPARKELAEFIRQRVPFFLSDEELENLWD